ncbi:uncharacterized protein [Nicotiana sylvestris]|uniref:uncharacterized protein n=1 Tax=Nicotiana sylvestris TaxID=4096 RepID=UPI00388CC8F6
MGPFVSSCRNTYILVAVDYVFKWVEAVALPNNEARSMVVFLKKNIFTLFGTPRAIINDGGSHFCNNAFDTLLAKYGVNHKVSTPYHPQASGTDWSKKLDDILWAYMTSYKTPIEYKATWALKKLNLEWEVAANLQVEQLNELDEFWFHAYSSSSLYKDKMKYLHDKYVRSKEFKEGDLTMVKSRGGNEKQKGKAESSRGRGRGQIKLPLAIRQSIGKMRKNIKAADRAAYHSEGSDYVPS